MINTHPIHAIPFPRVVERPAAWTVQDAEYAVRMLKEAVQKAG